MESFVPFGGFFSTPSELKGPIGGSYQCIPRCHLCNEKCEQEVVNVSKGGFTASIADQYQSSLPSWLQMAELGTNKGLGGKTKDDAMVLSAKVTGLQKKRCNTCQSLHHTQPYLETNIHREDSQFPTILGFQFDENKNGSADNHSSNNTNASLNDTKYKSVKSCMSMDLQKISASQSGIPFPLVSKTKNEISLSKLGGKPSKAEDFELGGVRSPPCGLSNSSMGDGSRTSPTSATSVIIELCLGMSSAPTYDEPKKPTNSNHTKLRQDFSGCFSQNVDSVNGSCNHPTQSSSCSCADFCGQFDPRDFRMLYRSLTERVGWQCEAISIICQTIARCQTRIEKCHGASPKGDIWFNFTGPDRFGKKKIALALAEKLYGSRENFICLDLCSPNGMIHANTNFDRQEINGYDLKFRGKTANDYIAGELFKKPLSIVFLENVDKADVLAQNSLSQAIQTGKFSDSHGREVSINNAMFVTTSTFRNGSKTVSCGDDYSNFNEDRILRARGWPMKILIEHAFGDNSTNHNLTMSAISRTGICNPIFVNKRKLMGTCGTLELLENLEMVKRAHKASTNYLDLNLPAEENEVQDTDNANSDNDSISENSKVWLQDFAAQVDETVIFKPFDFDALAEKLFGEIKEIFQKIVRSECLLEIDSVVMEQLLAAVYLSDNNRVVEDWVEQVLSRGFTEIQKRYNLAAHSVVKLVSCEGCFQEEQDSGVFLPQRIILN